MQADISTLEALLARVEAATGPDRELDAAIMFDLFAVPVSQKDDGGPSGYLWPEDNPSWSFGIRFPGKDREWFKTARAKNDGETLLIERDGALVLMNQMRIPKLTASLDAALALMRSIYPEVFVELSGPRKYLHIPTPMPNHWRAEIESTAGWGATASLAILSALLRALIAQSKEQAHG